MTVHCSTAPGFTLPAWMAKSPQNRFTAGVYNLAGFITTASGQRMAFVQYLSGYAVEPTDQRNRRIPLVRFESRLYKDIYQNN
jgi:hypothetical protein